MIVIRQKVINEMGKQKNIHLDGLSFKVHRPLFFDLPLANLVLSHKKISTAYYKRKITRRSVSKNFTSLYFDQNDLIRIRKGENVSPRRFLMDGLASHTSSYPKLERLSCLKRKEDDISDRIKQRYSSSLKYLHDLFKGSVEGVTIVRMWNVSIISSVIFGMFLMTMIYRYLGQGVYAGTSNADPAINNQTQTEISIDSSSKYPTAEADTDAGAANVDNSQYDEYAAQLVEDYNSKIQESRDSDNTEKDIKKMVDGYPIKKMAPYIARKDRLVATFLIAIAKKESDWGNHAPVSDGEDCNNYWGFRGKSEKVGSGGHTCFDNPEIAVDLVSKRLASLIYGEKMDTAAKMVSPWKCGYDCSWDTPEAVDKWVSDVDMYIDKYNDSVR